MFFSRWIYTSTNQGRVRTDVRRRRNVCATFQSFKSMFWIHKNFQDEVCLCRMDVTSFNWRHGITLRYTARGEGKDRERESAREAETRKSDELKMEWGLNKRPDGLSETVAVRNMKRGRGEGRVGDGEGGREGGEEKQQPDRREKITFVLSITHCIKAGRGERERAKRGKKKRERLVLRWGGRGGGASVGEAEGCVLAHMNHSSPFLPVCVPLASVSFGLQNRKVGAKSDSAPAATRHSQQLPPLWQVSSISLSPFFFFTALSLIQCLSFTHTHTHRHTHTLRQTLSHTHIQTSHTPGRGEDRTTGEVLHTFTTSYSPSHRQTLCPGCGRFSWGSPLDYWPPPGRSYFKVRGPCLRPADGSLFGDFF